MTKQDTKPQRKTVTQTSGEVWPPLIYNARVPFYIKVRDVFITALGWLLIVDLLEDIWVLVTQWLHVTVFKRQVTLDHMLWTLWGNVHEFFYLAMALVAVIVFRGLEHRQAIRRPIIKRAQPRAHVAQKQATDPTQTKSETPVPMPALLPASRVTKVTFDEQGKMHFTPSQSDTNHQS